MAIDSSLLERLPTRPGHWHPFDVAVPAGSSSASRPRSASQFAHLMAGLMAIVAALKRDRAVAAMAITGVLLGVVLLAQTISAYQFASGELVIREAQQQAARDAASLERAARAAGIGNPAALSSLLEQLHEGARDRIAWVLILDGQLRVLAQAGDRVHASFAAVDVPRRLDVRPITPRRDTKDGAQVLTFLLPLRLPPAGTRLLVSGEGTTWLSGPPVSPAVPRAAFAELALYRDAVSAQFGGLRVRMLVSALAALALLLSTTFMTIRLPRYLRGLELHTQLQLAASVQQDLFPTSLPRVPGYDVAAVCTPASELGGDFYDVLSIDDHRFVFMVGDVSGKGPSAALLMAAVSGAVHAAGAAAVDTDCRQWAGRLNTLLFERTAANRYVTLFVATLDSRTGTLTYVNAGHPPPVLVRHTDGHGGVERLERGGPAMGIVPNATFECGHISMDPGDVLVVYSDGMTEAVDPTGEQFGDDRLTESMARWLGLPPGAICARAIDDIRQFAPEQQDDQTIVAIARRSSGPSAGTRRGVTD